MTPAPPALAALLARPPEGVEVLGAMDRVEIRLVPISWAQRRGLVGEAAPPGYRRPALLLFLALFGLSLAALAEGQAVIPGAMLHASSALLIVLFIGFVVPAARELLGAGLQRAERALRAVRPSRLTLAAQRFEVEELGSSYSFELDAVRRAAAAPLRPQAEGGSAPGELRVRAIDGRFLLLRGCQLEHLRWLADVLEAGLAQRAAALRAAGHDLSRPPPEEEALREMAARAGERGDYPLPPRKR